MKSQNRKPPAAPAAYRPQPTPRVLQAKMATTPQTSAARTPQTGAARRAPGAPPAYRPQSTPRCLQLKSAAAPTSPPKPAQPIVTQSKGTIQRFAWALHDSRDMSKSDVVDENLNRAKVRYLRSETINDAPDKVRLFSRTLLNEGEAIHLHAHGHDTGLANISAATLANVLTAKFGLEALAGRVIVMHSCNTGSKTYGADVLKQLVQFARTDRVSLTGTTVFAPENYLVVEKNGLSYVAKEGVGLGDLRTEPRDQHLQPLGDGWKAWTVNGSGGVVPTDASGVVAVMQVDENKLKQKPEGKSKGWKGKEREEDPPEPVVRSKPKKGRVYLPPLREYEGGYYDDRSQLDGWEKDLIDRAFRSKSYPPK